MPTLGCSQNEAYGKSLSHNLNSGVPQISCDESSNSHLPYDGHKHIHNHIAISYNNYIASCNVATDIIHITHIRVIARYTGVSFQTFPKEGVKLTL